MRPRHLAVALLFLTLLHSSAGAQSFFSEVMEVRITNVDVIVTGKDGKPVAGLKKEDFEVYEDGVKKEISNFLEVQEDADAALTPVAGSPDAPTAPAPEDFRRRNITIFIDNAALKPQSRNAVLPHLEKFLDTNVRQGDEVAMVTWDNSLKLALESTSDRNLMRNAIKQLATQTARGSDIANEREQFQRHINDIIYIAARQDGKPTFEEAVSYARAYGMWATHQAQQRAEGLKAVIASLRGQPGRKIVVYVTQAFSSNPAEWAFAYLESIRESFTGDTTRGTLEAKTFDLPQLVPDIVQAANSSGVTVYTIDGSGKETDMGFADASQIVRAGSSGRMMVAPTEGMTMQTIAADTGGVALTGSTNWQLAFDTIASDLNTYYSLGYKASGEQQDRLKNLEVRVKNRKLKVRTRRAVIEPSVSSEMNDAVAANLFRDIGRNDLSIRATAAAGTAAAEAEKAVIPLTVTIPTDKLTLLPDGTDLTGSFSLFAAFLRSDGRVSKVARQPHSFRFPAASLPKRKEITVKLDVTTDANTDAISVGVMDEASRALGFASVKLGAQ